MDRYEHLGTVGEGSYGVVIKCKDKINGVFVAIKKFLETDADKAVKKIATREIRILKMLRHENLVNLIEVFRKNKRVYLVFEFIEHNLLEEIEKTINGLGEPRTKEIIYQVVRGLDFMHSNNFIHRDLKPENILINKTGLVKLCDFGFARQIALPNESYTDYVATRWYRSPELLVGDPKYGKPVDIWSVGVLAYEVLTSKPLFPGESDLDQLFLIVNSLGDLPDTMKMFFQQNQFYSNAKFPKIKNFNPLQNRLKKYSPSLVKFILEALILDPAKRATSSELLNHEFFTQNAWVDEFMIKLKNMVSLYETSLSTSIQASTTSHNHSNSYANTQSNTNTTQTKQATTEKTTNTYINTTTTTSTNTTSNNNNSKPVKTNNQPNHILKINVKNHPKLTKSFDLNNNNNLNTSTNNLLNKSLNLKESVNNTNSNSKNMSEMYIIKQKNFDLNVADSKHQLQTNNSNSNLTSQNSKKLPRIELVQSHSPKNESQPTTSLKNISINFNGSNALKTSEPSNFSNNNNNATTTTTTTTTNSNSNKLLKTKHDSLEFSYSKNLTNSISNNNPNSNTNENNLTSNSESNLNNIELNASLVLFNNGNESNTNNLTTTNDSSTHNNLKQINLASTTNSVYILEETYKLNKQKNAFGNKNTTNSRRDNTNTTDLNLPHVKQIEMFPKKEKNLIYEKKTYLMQVNNKK